MWIGIATITMSFAAYTSAMVVRQGSGADWQHIALPRHPLRQHPGAAAEQWNPRGGTPPAPAAWAAARRDGIRADSPGVGWLTVTLTLGLLFIVGQVIAWREPRRPRASTSPPPRSDFFYVFTALHALHLLGGIAALGYVLGRMRASSGGPPQAALGAASLYWHFMGVLWLYLLLVLATRL